MAENLSIPDHKPARARDIVEASVYLPRRGKRWIASFTGAEPGKQEWKSTGLTDREQALERAREWEAQARQVRAAFQLGPRKPFVRTRSKAAEEITRALERHEPLSQKDIALILGISERAVRAIEHRAFAKLRKHPLLRQVWFGEVGKRLESKCDLSEGLDCGVSQTELYALMSLTRTDAEVEALAHLLQATGVITVGSSQEFDFARPSLNGSVPESGVSS